MEKLSLRVLLYTILVQKAAVNLYGSFMISFLSVWDMHLYSPEYQSLST
jgi:hypothetical protein